MNMMMTTNNFSAVCPGDDAGCRVPVPGSPCWTHDSSTASHAGTEVASGPAEQGERSESMEYVREWIATASTEEEQAPEAQPECQSHLQCAETDDASSAAGEACSAEDLECIDGAYLSEDLIETQVAEAMRRLARLEQVGINPKELPTIRALFVRWTIANWERNNFGGRAVHRQAPEEASADEYPPMTREATQTVCNPDDSAPASNGHANPRRAALARRPRSRGIDKRKGCANVPLGHIRGAGSCIVKAADNQREIISLSRSFIPLEGDMIKSEMDDDVMSFMLA